MADRLSDILVTKAEVLLKEAYRVPTITAYNRLEPRPRTENFERSLRAEVRDALWMLTRQWQMGEFEADDAGSAIDARLLTHKSSVGTLALNGAAANPYDDNVPMEAMVERERVPFSYALKLQIGQLFLRLHKPALRTKYLPQYLTHFSIAPGLEADFRGQPEGLSLYTATHKRGIDGEKLLAAIAVGTFASTISISSGDTGALSAAAAELLSIYGRAYLQPEDDAADAWRPEQLDYRFSAFCPADPEAPGVALEASSYRSGHLDWWAFDIAEVDEDSGGGGDRGGNEPSPVQEERPISFLPVPAMFKGIPNPRFWEFEDREIDFGKLNAKTTDHLLLAFAEFGLVFGNDWFVIPYSLAVNSLCEVRGLVVTDVFGDRTMIRAAGAGAEADWERWSLFNPSRLGDMEAHSPIFFLAPAISNSLNADPLERVNYIRDEMANMAWAIEDVIPDATGKGLSGHEAADKTGVVPSPVTGSTAAIRYLLGVSVPENWIPFIPVHKGGSVQDIRFQRGAMPRLDATPGPDVVRAKGVLVTEHASPYFIDENEISSAGVIVERGFQRARWYDGRTFLWIGRARQTGRGQGSSNLRFDDIEPLGVEPPV